MTDDVTIARHDLEFIARLLDRVTDPDTLTLKWRADVHSAGRYLDAVLDESEPDRPLDDLPPRHAAATELTDWAGVDSARPAGDEGLQHAVSPQSGTLCGLPGEAVVVWRHHFSADRLDACTSCREATST